MTKICAYKKCKKPFETDSSWQIFCDKKCGRKHHNELRAKEIKTERTKGKKYVPKPKKILVTPEEQTTINRAVDSKHGTSGDPGRRVIGKEFQELKRLYESRERLAHL